MSKVVFAGPWLHRGWFVVPVAGMVAVMTEYQELSQRTAVVTGAASGIGEAITRMLVTSGARVAVLSRRHDRLSALADELGVLPVTVDITDASALVRAAADVSASLGRIDMLANVAGVMLPNPVVDGRDDEWTRMIDTNLTGLLGASRAFLPSLLAAAEIGPADMVNVSSIGAHVVFPDYAVYGATKAAVTQLSASLRSELGPLGVRVTNIEPGLTDTELGTHLDNPTLSAQLASMFEAIDSLAASDVADLVGFAVSRARHVNLGHATLLPTAQA